MKKLCSLILAAILLMSTAVAPALADDFTLRNGIHFGWTLEQIEAVETLTKNDDLITTDDGSHIEYKGKIAGYDDSVCMFFFDVDGKLTDMRYDFDATSRDDASSMYSTLSKSLTRQYGKPLGNTGGTLNIITGEAFDHFGLMVYLYTYLLNGGGDYYDYDEWIIDVNDYQVKIDLISYYVRNSSYEYTYKVVLSYKRFTDEDRLNALIENMAEQEAIDNDL